MMTAVRLLYSGYGRRRAIRLWVPAVVIGLLSIIAAQLSWAWLNRGRPIAEQARRVAEAGDLDTAERLYWQIVRSHPTDLENWIRFIDVHADRQHAGDDDTPGAADITKVSVTDAEIRKQIAAIGNPEVSSLATYWYGMQVIPKTADAVAITSLADREPPAYLANYLLGRAAMEDDDWATAARRFEREGLVFPKRREFLLRLAVSLWSSHNAWGEVRKRLQDPRYVIVQDAAFRLELATHDRDWPRILLWCWPATYVRTEAWPVALALLAAILWFTIAARLGRIGDPAPRRGLLYGLAFVLGILSIYPTLMAVTIEDSIFGFKLLGQPIPDAIYFVFGVGLREELCKLLLFLPLLPMLKRRGSRIEAMTCGALVGLGFAAEENISYFHMAAGAALSRFLTANFLHMSLTALVALSVFDASRGRSTSRDRFDLIFPLMVAIHGAYDFFLSTNGLSLAAMLLFIIVSRQFLRQLLIASSAEEEQGALRLLITSMFLLTGVSYVYATTLVGPLLAVQLVALGFLGVVIVIFMFVRELSPA
jgi:RsiW-degrading membrane proteinase PrsW (M82 family)